MARDAGSDAEWLAGCRAGDPAAAALLVARYQRALFRVSGRLVGRWDVAEEIVQEAFLRAFAHIHSIDERRGAFGWLLQTVVRLSRQWVQHSSQREIPSDVLPESEPLFAGSLPGVEGGVERAQQRAWVERALRRLPPKLREVVVLHYMADLPFDEISTIVGAPVAALRVRAFRARVLLRRWLAVAELP